MKTIYFSVTIILAFLAAFAPSPAHAGDGICATDSAQCTQGEAFSACQNHLEFTKAKISATMDGSTPLVPVVKKACTPAANSAKQYDCDVGAQGFTSYYGCFRTATIRQGYTRYANSCLLLPPMTARLVIGSESGQVCLDGCLYSKGATVPDKYELGDDPARVVTLASNWNPTGAVCDISGPDPAPKNEPECKQQGNMTQCVKPDGSHCATGSKGTQFCWGKGDNEPAKNNGDEYANRGTNGPAAPPAAPPAGGGGVSWGPPRDCVPMARTVDGYRQTYTVCGGGTNNPDDPPGDDDPPDGECKPEDAPCDGTASGGGTCDAPPTCAGDQINCAVLEQVWRNRCSGNGNKESGGQCTQSGAVSTFDCSGDKILCRQALVALEAKCRAQHADGELARDAGNGIDDEEAPESIFGELPDPTDLLNGSRISFASGQLFPSVTIYNRTWTAPPEIYSILDVVRAMVIAFFTFFAITRVFR